MHQTTTLETRKHSCKMPTAHLATVWASATRIQYCWGWEWDRWVLKLTSLNRPSVMATRCHYHGVVLGIGLGGVPCQMFWYLGEGVLYSEVQCIMDNGHMGSPCEQTDTSGNITFPQLRWRTVIIVVHKVLTLFHWGRSCDETRCERRLWGESAFLDSYPCAGDGAEICRSYRDDTGWTKQPGWTG